MILLLKIAHAGGGGFELLLPLLKLLTLFLSLPSRFIGLRLGLLSLGLGLLSFGLRLFRTNAGLLGLIPGCRRLRLSFHPRFNAGGFTLRERNSGRLEKPGNGGDLGGMHDALWRLPPTQTPNRHAGRPAIDASYLSALV